MDNDLTDLNIKWIKSLLLIELWEWRKQMSLLPFVNRTSALLICHLRKDMQGIVYALKTDFLELQIKEYHGKSDLVEKTHNFSNVKESWKDIDLVAYTSTLKIGKDSVPSTYLVGEWLIFSKMWLFQTVKASSSTIKAEEIADISNATIINYETAELLENKPKKTLEEMRSLDWHHIVNCYEILPESLTENFISKYGNYNHMKWFKTYKQL
ncbi:2119_t:CDS:2 [Funneliformis geosporum]|nr:2119_t:CDS:2 [Funneliformis geosporum]